jgi:hypothetical protein
MRRFGLLVALMVSAGLNACSSSNGGGTGGDGGTATGGNVGTGGAGGALAACGNATGPAKGETCNSVTAMGPCVTVTSSTAAPPSPAGGTLTAGTYNLIAVTDYVAADAAAPVVGDARQTLVLSNVTATSLTLDEAISSGTFLYRSSGTVAIDGVNSNYTETCTGDNPVQPTQFTATSSGLTLFQQQDNGDLRVTVFTKAN